MWNVDNILFLQLWVLWSAVSACGLLVIGFRAAVILSLVLSLSLLSILYSYPIWMNLIHHLQSSRPLQSCMSSISMH